MCVAFNSKIYRWPQDILKRFNEDIKSYAGKQNSGQKAELVGFLEANVEDYARNPSGVGARQALDKLQQLVKDLRTVHDSDVSTSAQLVTFILGNVNGSATAKSGAGTDETALRKMYGHLTLFPLFLADFTFELEATF